MRLPKLNVKLLRRIQRHIKAEPKRYDQGKWGERVEGDDAPACKTVGCIAGWAVFLSVSPRSWLSRYLGKNQGQGIGEYGPIETRARKELGLSIDEARDLFSPLNQDSTTGPEGVKAACRKIDALIESRKRGVMRIDEKLLERALDLSTERGLAEPDEDTKQAVRVLASNPRVNQAILGGIKHTTSLKDLACAFGTLFNLGFEAGRAYQELEANLDKQDAASA